MSRPDGSVVVPKAGLRGAGSSGSSAGWRTAVAGPLATLGVGLLAFDDIGPLRAVGGGLLASPGWIPLLAAAVLLVPGSGLSRRHALVGCCAAVVLYGTVLTVVTCLLSPGEVYGEAPAEKAVRVLGACIVWVLVLVAGWLLVRTVPRHLLVGAALFLGVMVVGAQLHRFGVHVLDDSGLLHSAQNAQQRVRGTRFEASSLGGGMVAATALLAVLVRGPRLRVLVGVGGLLATAVLSNSRGTNLIALAGAAAVLLLSFAVLVHRPGRTTVLVAAAVLVVLLVVSSLGLGVLVQGDLWRASGLSDGARGTSDATRAGWAEVALQVLLTSPLGLGFGAYLHETPQLLQTAIASLSTAYDPAALTELSGASLGLSDVGVSPKSAPTLAAFHLGWVGVLAVGALWTSVAVRAWGPLRSPSVPVAVCAASVMAVAATYYSSLTAWDQALVYGAVLGSGWFAGRGRHAAVRGERRRPGRRR